LFLETLSEINEMGIQVRSIPRLFEEEFGRVPLASLDTSWFLFDMRSLHRLGYRVTRRGLDMAAGILSLMGFLLVMPLVAAAIKIDSRGPVFFRQTRTGQSGRLFSMTKFRTMKVDAEQSGPVFTCKGDGRVTRVGRILRSTRIDELPQSVNLLRGEMSLIGPRPERPEFVGVFSEEIPFYGKRQLIKPGLTGWAQVHEGYTDSLNGTVRKLERDLYYLKHQSVALDLRIVAATVSAVVKLGGR
jgi:lipopolysaccharide/colanic/teichoic acid biosynthesis glycosyltransferase